MAKINIEIEATNKPATIVGAIIELHNNKKLKKETLERLKIMFRDYADPEKNYM